MRRVLCIALLAWLAATPLAHSAEDLVSGISQDLIEITSNYTGTDIVVFGAVERPAAAKGRDIVVVVRGPGTEITVRRRDRIAGVWVNRDAATFSGLPAFYFLASTRPLTSIARPEILEQHGLGAIHIRPSALHSHHDPVPFRQASVRLMTQQGLYTDAPGGVDFLSETLFRARVPVPASVARGQYNVEVYLFRDGDVVSAQSTPFFIDQTGLERRLFNLAHDSPFFYGLIAVAMSLLLGWITSVLLRRPG